MKGGIDMKEPVIIGNEGKRKDVMGIVILYLVMSVFASGIITTVIAMWIASKNIIVTVVIFIIVLVAVFFSFMQSPLNAGAKLVFDENSISYYGRDEIGLSLSQVVFGNGQDQRKAEMCIPLSNVESVRLNYMITGRTLSYQFMGRRLLMYVKKKSGGEIQVIPENLASEAGDYRRAVDFLEAHGIMVDDPHQLKPGLDKNNIEFASYIKENVEHGKDPYIPA